MKSIELFAGAGGQAEEMEPAFDALMARLKQDLFPGPTNRRDSRDERIWRFMFPI